MARRNRCRRPGRGRWFGLRGVVVRCPSLTGSSTELAHHANAMLPEKARTKVNAPQSSSRNPSSGSARLWMPPHHNPPKRQCRKPIDVNCAVVTSVDVGPVHGDAPCRLETVRWSKGRHRTAFLERQSPLECWFHQPKVPPTDRFRKQNQREAARRN